MADIRQNMVQEIGVQAPVSQQVVADTFVNTSAAERVSAQAQTQTVKAQANKQIGQAVTNLVGQAVKLGTQYAETKAQESIIGDMESADPETMTTFSDLAAARSQGAYTSQQARTEAAAILNAKKRENPMLASSYQRAYDSFFGSGGGGAAVFQKTEAEEMEDWKVKQGFTQFNIDPELYYSNRVEWDKQFTAHASLAQSNEYLTQRLTRVEAGQKLSKMEQQQTAPMLVNAMMSDRNSPLHIGSNITRMALSTPDGRSLLDENGVVAPSMVNRVLTNIDTLEAQTIAAVRQDYPDLSPDEFNSIISPVKTIFSRYRDNVQGGDVATAFEQQNKTFEQTAIYNARMRNPEAAENLAVMNSIIKGLPEIPLGMEIEYLRVAEDYLATANGVGIGDPRSTAALGEVADPASTKVVTETMGAILPHLGDSAYDARAAKLSVVGLSKEMGRNPENLSPRAYKELFTYVGDAARFAALDEDTQRTIRDNMGIALPKFMEDTLQAYESRIGRAGLGDRLKLELSTDSKTLQVVPVDRRDYEAVRQASNINRDIGGSNAMFKAAETVLGTSYVDALTQTESGQALLAAAGISETEQATQNPTEFEARIARSMDNTDKLIDQGADYLEANGVYSPVTDALLAKVDSLRAAAAENYMETGGMSASYSTPSRTGVRRNMVQANRHLDLLVQGKGNEARNVRIINNALSYLAGAGLGTPQEVNMSADELRAEFERHGSILQQTGYERMMEAQPTEGEDPIVFKGTLPRPFRQSELDAANAPEPEPEVDTSSEYLWSGFPPRPRRNPNYQPPEQPEAESFPVDMDDGVEEIPSVPRTERNIPEDAGTMVEPPEIPADEEGIKELQKIIGTEVDGKWGPKSQARYDLTYTDDVEKEEILDRLLVDEGTGDDVTGIDTGTYGVTDAARREVGGEDWPDADVAVAYWKNIENKLSTNLDSWEDLTDDQRAAVIDFSYNAGSLSKSVEDALSDGDLEGASETMLKYVVAGHTDDLERKGSLKGLAARRARAVNKLGALATIVEVRQDDDGTIVYLDENGDEVFTVESEYPRHDTSRAGTMAVE